MVLGSPDFRVRRADRRATRLMEAPIRVFR